jgi:AraC-like DNA-binding protein/tetratricopeptide (TPR) repeat protein
MRNCRFIVVLIALTGCSLAHGQNSYMSRLRETSNLLPGQAAKADSVLGVLLQEIIENQPPGSDSMLLLNYALLGHSGLYQGKLNLALDYYNKSLYLNRDKIYPKLYMGCLLNSAIILEKQFRFKEASETYQTLLNLAEGKNDSVLIADTWLNIGILNHKLKDDDNAVAIMEKLYTWHREKRDTLEMANVLQNIATCCFPNQIKKAESTLIQALDLYRRLKNPDLHYILINTNNLAELYIYQKRFAEGTRLLQDNIELSKKSGATEQQAIAYRLLAQCEIEAGGNLQNAREYIEKSEQLVRVSGRSDILRDLKETELLLQVRSGNFGEVKKILESYKQLYDESARENARIINTEFQTIHEVKKISEQKNLLQEGIVLKNRQLTLTLVALLASILAIVIIVMQYLRIRQAMKTMYQMNVEIAGSSPANPAHQVMSVNENPDTDDDDPESVNMIILYGAILERLESQKLYLDPTLSVQSMSESMNRNHRYVSKAIKEVGNTNFSTLVNRFRINEARRLLASGRDISINDVMLQSGFGSRQSFHRNFKMATGFTPADYLERAKKSTASTLYLPDNNQADSEP